MNQLVTLDIGYTNVMSVQDLKEQYPNLFKEIYDRGIRAEKRRDARFRMEAEIRESIQMLNRQASDSALRF
jgi:hypothetical protein